MPKLKSFSPKHLEEDAQTSGFFHCQKCGLFWFGMPDVADRCPEGPHGRPVRVALLCRDCDAVVPLNRLTEHLGSGEHRMCAKKRTTSN
jgi:hypothetical protein